MRPPRPRTSLPRLAAALAGCGGAKSADVDRCAGVACGAHAACLDGGTSGVCACDPGYTGDPAAGCTASASPALGGCAVFPPDHLFNTPIDGLRSLPVRRLHGHPRRRALHPDLAPPSTSQRRVLRHPFNVVHGDALGLEPHLLRRRLAGGERLRRRAGARRAERPCTGAALVPVFRCRPRRS